MPARPGAEREHDDEDELDRHAGRGEHVAVVDAGAHHHADTGAVQRQPHRDADHDGSCEDHEPHHRVAQIDRLAGRFDRGHQRQFDRADQPARRLDLIEIAAEHPQHQIRKHDREPDRDHGLAQILPLHAAEDDDLQHDPEQRHAEKRDDEAEHP